ncbi:MAG: hypothetical protein E6G12_08315 [Actinobacteria bacterium]|nr:MAG: hypothetical protein E6G12_08315 [Actinomycetota bacterium]
MAVVLHVHRPHDLHPHLPHPHVHPGFDEHPWRMVPVTLGTIVLLVTVLIVVCFAVAKALTGRAY